MSLRLIGVCATLLLLCGCETLSDIPDMLGGNNDKAPLPGKRISVLNNASHIKPDASLASTDVVVPELKSNDHWRQAGGGAQGMTGNLVLTGHSHDDSAHIGEGNGWDQPFYPSPIVAENLVFAMDAKGIITAHEALSISKIRWTNKSLASADEQDVLGGGVAFEGGHIYATNGRGKVVALDATNGKELWKQSIGVPLRAAPKVGGGRVYALSVDNQLFVLDATNGTQLWNHRGINENAGFLAVISPAVTDAIVVAPYSSGEIHALDSVSGQDVWSDSLLLARRNSATAGFSGIGGNPIIKDDVVYAAGSSGFFAANALLTGRRLWEQDVSSLNTPWIAGDFIYIISSDNELVCMVRADGRIKWTKQLPRFADEAKRKHPFAWRGPLMAGGQLLVAGLHGQMLEFSPKDGSSLGSIEIPEAITDTPIIAGGRMYFLTQDATLHVIY